MPTGTAHGLASSGFPIAVMGKTGTTNEFRDALFVGSTYGPEGITVAVRVGFDDNRSLGPKETGARVALPVFKELMLRVYREKLVGPVPTFPAQMEQNINDYLAGDSIAKGESLSALNPSNPPAPLSVRFTDRGEAQQRPVEPSGLWAIVRTVQD
jgi:membrane carboxypeptidase/penicillin-binding protein